MIVQVPTIRPPSSLMSAGEAGAERGDPEAQATAAQLDRVHRQAELAVAGAVHARPQRAVVVLGQLQADRDAVVAARVQLAVETRGLAPARDGLGERTRRLRAFRRAGLALDLVILGEPIALVFPEDGAGRDVDQSHRQLIHTGPLGLADVGQEQVRGRHQLRRDGLVGAGPDPRLTIDLVEEDVPARSERST